MIFKDGYIRTRLAIALLVMCVGFCLGAPAQTRPDKPLPAASRINLIEELKGVVSRTAADPSNTASVSKRWDGRKDLAGKTKSKVIDLLYEDVKAVIDDSGTRYQIYSIFSFYKTIPDASFAAKRQPKKATTKSAAVTHLVALTLQIHPYIGIEAQLATLPGSRDIKAATEQDRKNRIDGFNDALKVNNKLTPEQKSFVRSNFDQIMKIGDNITDQAIKANFPTERWIKEGLTRSYASKFTLKELNDLIDYFQGADGQQVLKYIRISNMAQMITANGGSLDFTQADKAEHDKFVATPIGAKFDTAYMHESIAYEEAKENAVRARVPNADGFAIYEPANLNRLFNKFVAENYRK